MILLSTKNPEINHLRECLQKSCPPGNETQSWSHFGQCVVKKWPELSLLGDVLIRTLFSKDSLRDLIVVPHKNRLSLVKKFHSSVDCRHQGMNITAEKLKQHFWWPNLLLDVRDVINSCVNCQQSKPSHFPSKPPLHPIRVGYPFQTVHIDIAGPMTPCENGVAYIVLMIDSFTGWVEAIPTADISAINIAEIFSREWIFRYGAPERLISDQGANVAGDIIRSLCKLLNIQKLCTTPYHPQGNGKAERSIGNVKKLMRTTCSNNSGRWAEVLPSVLFAIRTSRSRSTGFSPFRLMFCLLYTSPSPRD